VPTQAATVLAWALLVLMVFLEYRASVLIPSLPLYFLIPISLLAWFSGWRPALLAATTGFTVTLVIIILVGSRSLSPAAIYLSRFLTFAFSTLVARGLYIARQMLALFYQNPGWRALHRPMQVGIRLLVVPLHETGDEREDLDIDPALLPIYIQSGMAFGTASHPTTRMCLVLLEQAMQPGHVVLDIGCGTGILAIAAAKLGAETVQAIDIAPRAIEVARANLAHNQVSERVTLLLGSSDELVTDTLLASKAAPQEPTHSVTQTTRQQFDVILANLLAEAINDLLQSGIASLLKPNGVLITSGIRSSELESIEAAILGADLYIEQSIQEEDWCALVARRQ
jgi:ribosomal protein L11 methyltransferase